MPKAEVIAQTSHFALNLCRPGDERLAAILAEQGWTETTSAIKQAS
jgi:hypothetical protein